MLDVQSESAVQCAMDSGKDQSTEYVQELTTDLRFKARYERKGTKSGWKGLVV